MPNSNTNTPKTKGKSCRQLESLELKLKEGGLQPQNNDVLGMGKRKVKYTSKFKDYTQSINGQQSDETESSDDNDNADDRGDKVHIPMSQLYRRNKNKDNFKTTQIKTAKLDPDYCEGENDILDGAVPTQTQSHVKDVHLEEECKMEDQLLHGPLSRKELTAQFRKRKSYTILEKLRIAKKVRNGASYASLSRKLGIPESTLRTWMKNEARMQDQTVMSERASLQMHIRHAKYKKLDEALYSWYWEMRATGAGITDTVLIEKARRLARQLHGERNDFTGSKGWLSRFKQRHGLKRHPEFESRLNKIGIDADGSIIKKELDESISDKNPLDGSVTDGIVVQKTSDGSATESGETGQKDRLIGEAMYYKLSLKMTGRGDRRHADNASVSSREDDGSIGETEVLDNDLASRTVGASNCYAEIQQSDERVLESSESKTDERGFQTKRDCRGRLGSDDDCPLGHRKRLPPKQMIGNCKSSMVRVNDVRFTGKTGSAADNAATDPSLLSNNADGESDDLDDGEDVPSADDAIRGLETALTWFERHQAIVASNISGLRALRNIIIYAKSASGPLSQSSGIDPGREPEASEDEASPPRPFNAQLQQNGHR